AAAAIRPLAQRPGGNQPAVAVAAAAVDDFDLDVAAQGVMLQAVVADDDVAAGIRERPGSGSAVAVNPHRGPGAGGDEDGFVTALARIGIRLHPAREPVVLAPIAAAGHAGGPALGAQALDQGDGKGGLAAAAGNEVADDDHRHVNATAALQALVVQPAAR